MRVDGELQQVCGAAKAASTVNTWTACMITPCGVGVPYIPQAADYFQSMHWLLSSSALGRSLLYF